MKKLTLILSFTLILANFAQSQLFTIAGQDIGFAYIGPKVGTNFSQITNMDQVGYTITNRTGYQFGVVGELGLTNSLSFETELSFNSKGYILDDDNFSEYRSTRVNYLSVPLLAKFSFGGLGLSNIYAVGGTYNNVRLNAKEVWVFPDMQEHEESEPYKVTENYKVVDWGISFGAGAAYDIGYGLICLDVRYDLGFVDVDQVTDQSNRNRSLGVTLTFKYDAVDLFLRLRKQRGDSGA